MMKIILTCCFSCLLLMLSAQEKPVIFPEDIEASTFVLRCLCKPGIINKSRSRGLDIAYQYSSAATIEGEDIDLNPPLSRLKSTQLFVFKLKVPIINKNGFKVLAGYNYGAETFRFDRIGTDLGNTFSGLNNRRLKSNSISAIVTYSLNEKFYTSFRFKASSNGDYSGLNNFNRRYSVYNMIGVFGIKKHDNKEWGVGISFSNSFRRTIALPFLFYNKSFDDRWGIEIILPARLMGRYNLDSKTLLLFGFSYNSRSYSLDLENPETLNEQIYHLNHSEILAQISMERQIVPWIWFNLKAGYQLNFSTDFEAKNSELGSFKVEPKDAPFFRLGLFLSPPDGFF